VQCLTAYALVLLVTACSGNNTLRGFPESEVTATHATPALVQSCQARDGRLVVEIEDVFVREYPNFGAVPKGHGQSPLQGVTPRQVAGGTAPNSPVAEIHVTRKVCR